MGGYFSHSLPIVFAEFVVVAISIFVSFRCRNPVRFAIYLELMAH